MGKYIAKISGADGDFSIYLNGKTLEAHTQSGIEEISDGEFEHVPTDKECVERVYEMYNGIGWEIEDCISYED